MDSPSEGTQSASLCSYLYQESTGTPLACGSLEGPDGALRVFPAPSFHTGDPRHLQVPRSHGPHQPLPPPITEALPLA